jgi:hypothetical protein
LEDEVQATQRVTADSTAPRAARKVVGRKCIWQGGVVTLNIPAARFLAHHALKGEGGESLNYAQYGMALRGGVINVFLHDIVDPMAYAGKKVAGAIEIWEKTMEGGARYLYIDFRPAEGSAITHKVTVVQGLCPDRYKSENFVVFETPIFGQGAIVLSALF